VNIGEEQELMPMLLEEFPHLHMSDHTWHELWRRGIKQIENLTTAYEENKRRKSKAQLQVRCPSDILLAEMLLSTSILSYTCLKYLSCLGSSIDRLLASGSKGLRSEPSLSQTADCWES
jgi:hypothetical protein